MQKSEINEKLINNFYRIKVAPRSSILREWEKLEPSQIYELLKNCSPGAHHQAKELIFEMVLKKWTLLATAHDIGSKNPSEKLHITIRIGSGKAHHLYCREISGNSLQITKITKG